MVKGNPTGALTKCTPAITKAIAVLIAKKGVPVEHAAVVSGIGARTVWTWLEEGEKGVEPYRSFRQAIEKAQAEKLAAMAETVHTAAAPVAHGGLGDVKAAQFVLERADRKNYGLRVEVAVEAELRAIVDRVEKVFDGEPELCERVLAALSGGE